MSLSLNPDHLKRYKDLALLLIRYGRSDIISTSGLDEMVTEEERRAHQKSSPKAEELPKDLEKLGPTFVKLGQFLSTRSDMLPSDYIEALSRLQDRAEEFSFQKVREIVASELGLPIERLYSSFDETPLAAASLAQVHRAVLRDGRSVAVKVQRPGIRRRIAGDLEVFLDVAGFLDRHVDAARRFMLHDTIEEFRKAIIRELDFRLEARNLTVLTENLAQRKSIVIPSPIEAFTTSKVLTMDYIRGSNIRHIPPARRMEIDGPLLAEELFGAYLQQILVDGFYHADPHPGNVFLTDDGKIALIDLGMVARISEDLQKKLLRLTVAISGGKVDEAVEYAADIGEKTPEFDEAAFSRHVKELISKYQRATIGQIEVGRVILEVLKGAGESGFRLPSELAMLGKCLLNLDEIGRTLDPSFDPNAAIRRNASMLFRQRLSKSFSSTNIYELVMDSKDLVENLPKRLGKIADSLAGNKFRMNVNAIDEKYLMTGLQKIANRLTVGLILAAVIIGAALMMQVQTPQFMIFGYPGIAMIFFFLAAAGGLFLASAILLHDERTRKKPKKPGV
ncbi:MAG: AarF/ABC1/UbiB kinase family protein [Syntrophobacteraceae bacterium]